MASDEDDDELAQLRAQRLAQLGTAGMTLSMLRQRQLADGTREECFADEKESSRLAANNDDEGDEQNGQGEGEEEEIPEEELAQADDLRTQFPLSFGEQEKPAARLDLAHAATQRTAGPRPAARHFPLTPDDEATVYPPAPAGPQAGAGLLAANDEPEVGPRPPPEDGFEEGGELDGQGLGEADEETDPYALPISHEVAFEGQGKVVTALDVDRAGARVLAGSRDYSVKMFDFAGMKSDLRAFRTLTPSDGHPVNALAWSPTGDAFLAVTGAAKVKVYERDGIERGESVQGDMYIRDAKNTKGHVSPATSGRWHPADRHMALTGSEDGTLRLWDTTTVTQRTVIKPTLAKPGRVAVTAVGYSCDGGLIGAGLVDGTLQLWDARGKFGASAAVGQVLPPKAQMLGRQDWKYVSGGGQLVRGAHEAGCEMTGLAFSLNGATLLSRSTDATLKVWDVRKFKAPAHMYADLPADHASTGVIFSPDERLILTGVSAGRAGAGGALVFIDTVRREVVRRVGMPASVVALAWHERLNQILLGVGDKKAGSVRVLYSPSLSERGALMCAARKPRAPDPFDFQAPLVIHTPHALPMFREPRGSGKRKRERDRMDAHATQRPDPGAAAKTLKPGSGGRIGTTGGTLLTQYILKNQGKLKDPKEEDIRASILRHTDTGDQFGTFTKAYAKTQPERIFAAEEQEDDGGEEPDQQ